MDLLELLLDDPSINEYLRARPESDWFPAIKKILMIGLNTLKACEDSGLMNLNPDLERPKYRSNVRPKSQKFIGVIKSSRKTPKSSLKRSRRSSTRNKKRFNTNENEDPTSEILSHESPRNSAVDNSNSGEFTFKLSNGMKQAFHKEFSKLIPHLN